MTQLKGPQACACGNPTRTGRARLCHECTEERFQKAIRAWQRGWSRPLAAERSGLTEQEFLYLLDRRKVDLKKLPHSRKRRRRAWKSTPEAIAAQRAGKKEYIRALVNAPLPVSKRCNKCKKVKPQNEFYVESGRAVDEDGNRSKILSYQCKLCTRARVKRYQENMTPEQREQRCRTRREWENFHAQELREQEGRERRYVKHPLGRKSQAAQFGIKLDPKPFQDWIRDRCEHYASSLGPEELAQNEGYNQGLSHLARACRIADRTLRRFLDGYEVVSHGERKGERRPITGIPLKTVDECLSNEGSTFLFELYPEDTKASGAMVAA